MNPDLIKNESFLTLSRQTASIYIEHLRAYPLQLVLTLVMLPFGVIFMSILNPLIGSAIIDRVASNTYDPSVGVIAEFGPFVLLYVISQLSGNAVWRINGFIFADFQTKAIRDIESRVFSWLSGHSYAFYANSFSGALVAQHKRFVGSFERIVDMMYWDMYRTLVLVLISVGVVAYYVPWLGGLMLLWAIVFTGASMWLNIKKSKYSRLFASSDSQVTARIADFITNILTVKVFSSSPMEQAAFEERIEEKRSRFRKVIWYSEWIFVMQGALITASYGFVWLLSINLYVNGTITLGVLLLIWLYWSQLLRELFFVGRFVGRIEFALSDAAEMTKIITTPHHVKDPEHPEQLAQGDGSIAFNNVTFSYESDQPLFKDFNLVIPAGQKVGLVGPSGGGKTSITKLLLRFTDISSGSITINGQDIATVTQDDARSTIAYVPQEPLLFHRTLAENIGYAHSSLDMKAIKKAAKHARAEGFVKKLSHGYDTLVGERGVKLSGGEKQRVAIARAILKDSPILLLDEATSALDSESEKLIQAALDDLMEHKTAIVIAHRLSTIQKLDRIIVMDNGAIVEDGTHTELLANDGLYSELWSHQTGGFLE